VTTGVNDVVAQRVRIYDDKRGSPQCRRRKYAIRIREADGLGDVVEVELPDHALHEPLQFLSPLLVSPLPSDELGEEWRGVWRRFVGVGRKFVSH
jgi:hypothetical protein